MKLRSTAAHSACQGLCAATGGTHACISSAAENAALVGLLGGTTATCSYASQTGCGWIGLYQDPTNLGSTVGWDNWASGCTSSYRNWQPGDPNDYGGGDENCAMVGWSGTTTWYDAPCGMRASCVCELTLDASNEPATQDSSSGG